MKVPGSDLFTIQHLSQSTACGGEYLDPEGVIRSPFSPSLHPHNLDCVYVLRQPVGRAITLNFTSFDVESTYWSSSCRYDYLEVSTKLKELVLNFAFLSVKELYWCIIIQRKNLLKHSIK